MPNPQREGTLKVLMTIKKRTRPGFTIVELLIVIVVISILAAITIIAYNGIQARARASAASSALAQASKKLALYQVDNSAYPADLATVGITNSSDVSYQYSYNNSLTPATFCITATSGTVSYNTTQTSTPQTGGCAGHGVGGQSAVTNLANNPGAELNAANMNAIAVNASLRDTSWASSGAASYILTPSAASNDSFMNAGGDLGAFRAGLQAGKTYTISAIVRLTAALASTLSNNGSRQITAWYTNAVGTHIKTAGTQASNSLGQTRVTVTYSIPSDAIGAWLRFYNGASAGNGSVWWDDIMITEGSTQYNYADGNSANWVWNGSANSSTSTGPAL